MLMLENFGLCVVGEMFYLVKMIDGKVNWIMDFIMLIDNKGIVDFDKVFVCFCVVFINVWNNCLENDGFNCLVLMGGLIGCEVFIFCVYVKYMC